MAVVATGGLLTATAFNLFVLPALYLRLGWGTDADGADGDALMWARSLLTRLRSGARS